MKGKIEIKVEGHLDKKWMDWFEGMVISYEDANTILSGDIKDEAHLHGVLNQIRDLNLKLISINPDETNNKQKSLKNETS
jgi:hypothetical protein